MSFRFYPSSKTEVPVALACDPVVAAANSEQDLAGYLETGDPSHLVLPAGASLAIMRPPSPQDCGRALDDAGRRPFLGEHLHRTIEQDQEARAHERAADEDKAAWSELRASEAPDAAELERIEAEYTAALQRAAARRARLREALDDEEREALIHRGRWHERYVRALVRHALVYLPVIDAETGEPVERSVFAADPMRWLDQVDPPALRAELISELFVHAHRLEGLSAVGKARCAARPGSGPTSAPCPSGTARTASGTPACSGPEAAAEDPSPA